MQSTQLRYGSKYTNTKSRKLSWRTSSLKNSMRSRQRSLQTMIWLTHFGGSRTTLKESSSRPNTPLSPTSRKTSSTAKSALNASSCISSISTPIKLRTGKGRIIPNLTSSSLKMKFIRTTLKRSKSKSSEVRIECNKHLSAETSLCRKISILKDWRK